MRLSLAAAAVAGVTAIIACAAHTPGTRHAEGPRAGTSDEVGLLVGLSSGKTLWIAPQGAAMRLVATKANLLVPRADGFWWVGTARRCRVEASGGDWVEVTDFVGSEEALFVTRAGQPARVTLGGGPCDEAEQETLRRRAARARAAADSAAGGDPALRDSLVADATERQPDGLACSVERRTVTFVSPSAIAVEERNSATEYCSPAKYYTSGENTVIRFASNERLPLRSLLSASQRAAVEKEFAESGGCGFEDELTVDRVDSSWAVRRAEGAWVTSFWVNGPIVCRGGLDLELAVPLPASFTGDAPLPVAWAELRRQVPNARDAAGSPAGAHLAVLVADTLSVVRVRRGSIGEPVVKIPVEWTDEFVMLRWTSATEVAQWNRTIPALPEPVVLVEAPASPPDVR